MVSGKHRIASLLCQSTYYGEFSCMGFIGADQAFVYILVPRKRIHRICQLPEKVLCLALFPHPHTKRKKSGLDTRD